MPMIEVFLLVCFIFQVSFVSAVTNPDDYSALLSLKDGWENTPESWVGSDPCGGSWEGIGCIDSHVNSIMLASMGLSGELPGDIQSLSELQILDLSYNKGVSGPLPQGIGSLTKLTSLILIGCSFSGSIPDSIGSLKQLETLSLNSNKFIGQIPPSFGSLSNLHWLDIADNMLTGTLPVSNGTTPGLDMLVKTRHFHFGNNQLNGEIPSQLFHSDMSLIHLLLENNQFIGKIPSSIGLVQTLEAVRLDKNKLNGPVPANISNLTDVRELFLSNNGLSGRLPDLTGMNSLNYLDMSNNTFDSSDFPPWISTLESLTTVVMENTRIRGQIPDTLFGLSQLQSVILSNNQLNGTLKIGSNYSSDLQLMDLQNNSIEYFTQKAGGYAIQIILANNPVCEGDSTENYCLIARMANSSYSTPKNCLNPKCRSGKICSPTCKCGYAYTGTLYFRAPSFSNLGNSSAYESLRQKMMFVFQSHQISVDSVSLSNPNKNVDNYLQLNLEIFPSGLDHFNRTAISAIGFVLSNQTFKPPPSFGPYFFIAENYQYFTGTVTGARKSSGNGIIIGAALGGSVLVLLLLVAGFYAFRQKRRAEDAAKQIDPFSSWGREKNSGSVPELKGTKSFSFEELRRCTNNFSEANVIGSGGYGKVYKAILPNGKLVAVKRAQRSSMQGALEFKTEIELLSRVHHKNVVGLDGFCFDQVEQMLVYEFIPNGTLKDALSGKSGIRLDWMRRLRIALGASRGIQYLHDLADPPIIHRDIKSNNILLDQRLNAKVADFGLSKPMDDIEKTHITTQVKGTMGYMDPEYYMTDQLSEKSDVYSFGVLLFELLTGRPPIEKGKYIVREVKQAMDVTKVLYNLHELIDPSILYNIVPKSVEKFVDLALNCVEDVGARRPSMSNVVKEIESIMEMAGLNPHAESTSTSDSYGGVTKGTDHPYSDESLVLYSGGSPHPKSESNFLKISWLMEGNKLPVLVHLISILMRILHLCLIILFSTATVISHGAKLWI